VTLFATSTGPPQSSCVWGRRRIAYDQSKL